MLNGDTNVRIQPRSLGSREIKAEITNLVSKFNHFLI